MVHSIEYTAYKIHGTHNIHTMVSGIPLILGLRTSM